MFCSRFEPHFPTLLWLHAIWNCRLDYMLVGFYEWEPPFRLYNFLCLPPLGCIPLKKFAFNYSLSLPLHLKYRSYIFFIFIVIKSTLPFVPLLFCQVSLNTTTLALNRSCSTHTWGQTCFRDSERSATPFSCVYNSRASWWVTAHSPWLMFLWS